MDLYFRSDRGSTLSRSNIICPRYGKIIKNEEDANVEIYITADGNEEGTIWIYPLSKNINVDFSQNY